ncbi:MAG: MATE family efflux transporter [Bellilinea sp.]
MLRYLFTDKTYYRTLRRLAIPIILQYLISSSMNIIDVAMIGQLGETAVAAVGLSNQAFFIMTLVMFGISSGAAIFSAQYWGQQDITSIRRVLGICLAIATSAAVIFTIIGVVTPGSFLGIFTEDQAVVTLGSRYLRIVGLSYIVTSITYSYSAVLRSTEEVRLPMAISSFAILFKTVLSYLLIFGHLGFPKLGVEGAAIGTLIARYLECIILLIFVYRRKTPAAITPSDLHGYDRIFLKRFFHTVLPVAFNELAWSLGVTVYTVVYARISTEAIVAVNIVFSIENLAFVAFLAISDATGIMIGNQIGAGREDQAFDYGRRSLTIGIIGALMVGVLVYLNINNIIQIYKISAVSLEYTARVMAISASVLWLRVSNMLIIVGILRPGGDTRFGLALDLISLWFIGVPLALITGLWLKLPVYWVYLIVNAEELIKFGIGLRRVGSRRWINNLVRPVAVEPVVDS